MTWDEGTSTWSHIITVLAVPCGTVVRSLNAQGLLVRMQLAGRTDLNDEKAEEYLEKMLRAIKTSTRDSAVWRHADLWAEIFDVWYCCTCNRYKFTKTSSISSIYHDTTMIVVIKIFGTHSPLVIPFQRYSSCHHHLLVTYDTLFMMSGGSSTVELLLIDSE